MAGGKDAFKSPLTLDKPAPLTGGQTVTRQTPSGDLMEAQPDHMFDFVNDGEAAPGSGDPTFRSPSVWYRLQPNTPGQVPWSGFTCGGWDLEEERGHSRALAAPS